MQVESTVLDVVDQVVGDIRQLVVTGSDLTPSPQPSMSAVLGWSQAQAGTSLGVRGVIVRAERSRRALHQVPDQGLN